MNNDKNQEAFLEEIGLTGEDIEMCELETEEDIQKLKNSLRLRFPVFISNIIKILLYKEEINLACFLTAYYELSLDENMIFAAIEQKSFQWLNYVWAFGKNYVGPRRLERSEKISLTNLFQFIKKKNSKIKETERDIEMVCEWFLEGKEDDVLKALLYNY